MSPARLLAALIAPALLAAAGVESAAAGGWAAEIHLGGAWNMPLPLVIRQENEEPLRVRARWETRALRFPLYYVVRAAKHDGDRGWAIDLTHHKIHLTNPPAGVQSFAVSHGYNLLTVQRLVEQDARRLGVGAGVVIAHPENEVRGRRLDERGGTFGGGYHLAGPTVGGLVSWLPARRDGPYAIAEARLSLSYARVPVAGGHARVPNVALHVTVGLGWERAP